MASRYWVGGTAAWDGTAGTKWALTSGGTGGQAIPTSSDDVFFDAASGAVTVTWSAASPTVASINSTGFTGTHATGSNSKTLTGANPWISPATCTITGAPTLTISTTSSGIVGVNCDHASPSSTNAPNFNFTGGTYSLGLSGAGFNSVNFTGSSCTVSGGITLYGNLTLSTGGTFTAINMTFAGSSTVTSNGKTTSSVVINGVGITVTLADAMTVAATEVFQLTQGTINLNNFTLSCGKLIDVYVSTPRSIAFGSAGSGNIVLTNTAGANTIIFSIGVITGFTSTGTGKIIRNQVASAEISSAYPFDITVNGGSAGLIISSPVKNLDLTGSTCAVTGYPQNYGNLTLATGGTYTGLTPQFYATATINTNNKTVADVYISVAGITVTLNGNLTLGTANTFYLTAGTLDLAGFNLNCGSFSSSNSTTRAIAFGSGNIALTSTTAATTVLSMATATGFTWTGTGGFTRNQAATATVNFGTTGGGATTNAPNLTINAGAADLTIATGSYFKNLDFTGSTSTVTLTSINMAGNLTLAAGGTYTALTPTFLTSATVTSNGKTLSNTNINAAGITVTLADAMTVDIASTFTLTQGTLDLAGLTLSTGIFSSNNSNTRAISFGSGNIALTSTTAAATVLSMSTLTGFTCTGTGGFTRNQAATATVTFGVTGGTTTNATNFTVNAGASALTITSGSYFKNLNFTGSTSTVTATYNACGNLTLATGGTYTAVVPTFLASGTVTSSGKTLGNTNINAAGITVTLADTMTLGTTSTFTLTQGTIDLAGLTLSIGFFSSSSANTRSIAFGSTGKIQLTSATTSTIWTTAIVTNFSYTGTSNVEDIGAGATVTKTINTGAMSESQALNWTINETTGATANTVTFSANSAVRNLTINGTNGGRYQISNSALTIYGNYTYGGSYTPGKTSVFFNGSTDTIRNLTTASPVLDLSTGDFTIEAWIYKTASQQGNILSLVNVSSGSNAGLSFQTSATNTITQNDGVTATVSAGTISLNTWTHVAAVRTSGNTQLYVNGVAVGATFTQAPRASQYFAIGCTVTATFIFFPGYISNLRVVKGVAVYSGNFAPPSLAPLATSGAASASAYPSTTNVNTTFAASATSVLACQSAMDILVDNSVYKFPISISGTPIASFVNPYSAPLFPLITAGANAWTFASTGTQTITTAGLTHDIPITFAGIGGTATLQDALNIGISRTTTLTNGTINLNNLTLSTGVFSSSNSNTRVIAFGSTGKIQLTRGTTTGTNWTTTISTGFSYTGTSNIESFAGGTVTKSFDVGSMTEAQSLNFTIKDVAGTIAFTGGNTVKNLTLNGAFTLNNIAITIYGDYLYTAATTVVAGVNAWTFATTGTQSINTGGLTHSFPWTFNGVGGTFNLSSGVTLGSTLTLTLTNGTLDLNGYTFTTGIFTTGVGTKNITFDGGTLALASSGTAFNNVNPTGFTTTAGTGTGTITLTSGSAKTFAGAGSTYNCALNQGGVGALTLTGSNTFNNITNTYKSTGATTITFTAGTTTTVSNFTASGESGRLLTLNTDTGAAATLSDASGTVSVSYCSIFNSAATGGASWLALTSNGNINNGGNSGWVFGSTGNMFLMFS